MRRLIFAALAFAAACGACLAQSGPVTGITIKDPICWNSDGTIDKNCNRFMDAVAGLPSQRANDGGSIYPVQSQAGPVTVGGPLNAATITAPAGATAAVPQPDGSVVFVRPIIDGLIPYIVSALGSVIVGLGYWLVSILKSKYKVDIDQATADRYISQIDKAAEMQAGKFLASLAAKDMNKSIDVHNPTIAAMANDVVKRLPQEAASIGMTPDKAADWIVGHIGKMQAAAPVAHSEATAINPPVVDTENKGA